jgi:hypothetical protein
MKIGSMITSVKVSRKGFYQNRVINFWLNMSETLVRPIPLILKPHWVAASTGLEKRNCLHL